MAKSAIENYAILHTIGEGQFAKVKLAQHVLTKEVVDIKVNPKTNQQGVGLGQRQHCLAQLLHTHPRPTSMDALHRWTLVHVQPEPQTALE